jgi:uncharacterized protein YdaU (DUF1376 family)
MAKKKEVKRIRKSPPSINFWPDDFIGGTQGMSAEAVGAYIRLLCYQWANGEIPVCPESRRRISGVDHIHWDRVWNELKSKFKVGCKDQDGRERFYFNERMRADRSKAMTAYRKSVKVARANGLKGGRKPKNKNPDGFPEETELGSVENPVPEEGRRKKEENTTLKEECFSLQASARDDRDLAVRRPDRQTTSPPPTEAKPTEPTRNEHEFVWTPKMSGKRPSRFQIPAEHDTSEYRESLETYLDWLENHPKGLNPVTVQSNLENMLRSGLDAKSAVEALERTVRVGGDYPRILLTELPARAPGAKYGAQEADEERRYPSANELRAAGVI